MEKHGGFADVDFEPLDPRRMSAAAAKQCKSTEAD
jgi:hypothetical protein